MTGQAALIHNLPHLTTSFIGRQTEIAEIGRLLDAPTCQLLTLVGPGGIGKTRLAIEIAREQQEKFPHGVWFVALAPLTASDQIPAAIIKALDIQIGGQPSLDDEILAFLKNKNLLLVLDNFEHLLPGAGIVEAIATTAPGVKILVTSRTTLNMQAEWTQNLSGMSYPASDTSDHWDEYSAIRLFAERARRVRPDFSLAQSSNCVVRICQLLDGMPLALELAAAWIKTIPCDVVAQQIQQSLDFLVSNRRDLPERQRSIRAVFDHSWNLLTPEERQAFPRFSVFHGGCILEAAERVTGASLPMVASLVEKSLLTLEPSGRYGIHELLRQYGEEKLITSGELDTARDAHSAYYCHFMSQREPDIKHGRQVAALDTLEPDVENIRTAWLWASDQRDFAAIDEALEVLYFLFSTGIRTEELYVLMEFTYKRLAPLGDEPPQRAWRRVLAQLGFGSKEEQRARCERAVALARLYNDQAEIGVSLHWLGEVLNNMRRHQEAILYLEEALRLLRAAGELYYAGRTLNELGRCYVFMGEPANGIPYSQEALKLRRERNDRIGIAWCLNDLGAAHYRIGQTDEAERYHVEAIRYFAEVRSFYGLSWSYGLLINLSFWAGDLEQAQQWGEAYLEVCKAHHSDPMPYPRSRLGLVAALLGDYERCRSLCQSGTEFPGETFDAHLALAIAACGIGDPDNARPHFLEMFEGDDMLYPYRYYWQIPCLPIAAILLDSGGEREWAVELLALAFSNPPYLIGWMKRWSVVRDLLDKLENKLGADVFSAAWERGEQFNLDETLAVLRGHFLNDPDAQQEANQALNEPLTLRELEVLNLIYAGLSNREIAERFVLAESTVKRHINHIYGKLAVETRPQALARARELGLLK